MKQDATHDGDHGPRYDSDKPNECNPNLRITNYRHGDLSCKCIRGRC